MLQNLKELARVLQEQYQSTFDAGDRVLPKGFVERVRSIDGAKITYFKYTFVVESTSTNKIYFPNQLWFVAAYFADYYTAISQYIKVLKERLKINDDVLKGCKGNREKAEATLNQFSELESIDKDYLATFMTDYNWWGGGKTIDRQDYYYSPIISLCGLVNASQSYVAEMCRYLASDVESLNLLKGINATSRPTVIVSSKETYTKEELIEKMVDIYTNQDIAATAAGCVFVFQYGKFVVDKYSASELIEAASQKDERIKTRYATELNGAYLAYRYIKEHHLQMPKIEDIKSGMWMDNITDNILWSYLRALRTKPFLLLAGISGTGKSRIVREFAFKSCPAYLQDKDHTTPGNYCMIEVKPNWHDSSELLGYYSNISKNYQFKKFVKFLVKAKMNPEVPFFVCLDEMNLAPVEQYFAEFLSLLETRKNVEGHAATGVLVDGNYFVEKQETKDDKGNIIMTREIRRTDGQWYTEFFKNTMSEEEKEIANAHTEFSLIDKGLTLPDNVFIIGTVNMDDTTHQFSRKVIDRAMTIEMNGGNLEDMFGHSADLDYSDNPNPLSDFQPRYITADEVLNAHSDIANNIVTDLPTKLEEINKCLEGTPFQVSYRVLNELCIYLGVLLDDGVAYDEAVAAAVDQITLMKILPRIEGDQDLLGVGEDSKLALLMQKFDAETASYKKLKEMNDRLEGGFTRFWP